jgi:hypothetical protein
MFGFFKHKQRTVEFKRFYHWDAFSVAAPAEWNQNESKNNFLSITAPFDAATVTASSYNKEGATLSEFARLRYSAVHKCFSPIREEQRRRSNGFEILLREYEGIWPGNRSTTLYLVACVQLTERVFVSLTITTTPKEFKKNRKIYEDIVNSIQVSPA